MILIFLLLRMGKEHVKRRRVTAITLKQLGIFMFKKIKTNTSKNMTVKQTPFYRSVCRPESLQIFLLSKNIFFINLILCDCCLGPTRGSRILSNVGSIKMYLATPL